MDQLRQYKSCISCGASIEYNEEICYNCGDDGFGEYLYENSPNKDFLSKK